MAKLTKREFMELEAKTGYKKVREDRDTFVGCRPTVFEPKHLRRTHDRQEAKKLCREYC